MSQVLLINACLLLLACAPVLCDMENNRDNALIAVDSEVEIEDDNSLSPEENDLDSAEMFVPTNEWQTVQKGQKIPSGLHVRMSMKTGEKEAKLMDAENSFHSPHEKTEEDMYGVNKHKMSADELKKLVKNFKYKSYDIETGAATPEDEDRKKEIKKKFRNYEELKEEMKELKLKVKTESEIVTDLMKKLNESSTKNELIPVLEDLEYYIHQIDNAHLFCDLGGMELSLKLMNDSDATIRAAITHVLGSGMQSNSKIQIQAMEAGILYQLLKIISVDADSSVRKKAVFALSAHLRQFPFAQKKFLEHGGFTLLLDVCSRDKTLELKIVTLFTDLLEEYDHNILLNHSSDKSNQEKARQYSSLKIRESIASKEWCRLIVGMLSSSSDHDRLEKVLQAMRTVSDECVTEFSLSRQHLLQLKTHYWQLAGKESQAAEDIENFYMSIHSILQTIISKLPHVEL